MKGLVFWSAALVSTAACQRAAEEPAPREAQVSSQATTPSAPKAPIASAAVTATAAPTALAPTPTPTCPPDPDKAGPKIPTYTLSIPEVKGAQIEAEFVWAPRDSERGLMYRTSMAENHGMLFRLPRKDQTFWMHNTCISLDMLFIEGDGKIVGILENVPTLNDEPRSVGVPSEYVLEMNAGWCKSHGVRSGQKVTLPDPIKKLIVR